MKIKMIEVYGWYGTFAILLAYGLMSFSVISMSNVWYLLLNGTGALGLVAVSFYHKNYQLGVLNIIWTLVTIITALNIFF